QKGSNHLLGTGTSDNQITTYLGNPTLPKSINFLLCRQGHAALHGNTFPDYKIMVHSPYSTCRSHFKKCLLVPVGNGVRGRHDTSILAQYHFRRGPGKRNTHGSLQNNTITRQSGF